MKMFENEKIETKKSKRRLQTSCTCAARNVPREQHELGEKIYDTARNVLAIGIFFLSSSRLNPSLGVGAPEKKRTGKKRGM
jgi:DUF1680 family protein